MGVVSFRLAPELEAWLKAHKLAPGPFAQRAVAEAIRREEIKENRAWLDAHRVKLDRPSHELIREDRDARAAGLRP